MSIVFDKYIDNPAGEGNTVITNRSMYKDLYTRKFNAVMVREQGKINYTLYKGEDKEDSHYVHFKIPSEVVPDCYYDVVLRFYTDNNAYKSEANLRRYYVQFYSNDPAFVYTFAHSFIKNGIFIDDLKPKMAKQSIKKVAKTKNPNDNVWYVKSLYFAYLAMNKYNLWGKSYFSGFRYHKYNKRQLLKDITNAEDKIRERTEKEAKIKLDTQRENKKTQETTTPDNAVKAVKTVKTVGKVKTAKKVQPTRASKRH